MASGSRFKIVFGPDPTRRLYSIKLLYIKLSPPATHGFIPRIRRKKLLEKLAKYGITERDFEGARQDDGSYVFWYGNCYMLLIKPVK